MLAHSERRIAAEFDLLQELAALNPDRIQALARDGASITLQLHGPAGFRAEPAEADRPAGELVPGTAAQNPVLEHSIRIVFPVHFPAVPMELFLQTPVQHPNVHPETGFVCLWQTHRVTYTTEHAMHRLVAMLGGTLQNPVALHVMQPEALRHPSPSQPSPLRGIAHGEAELRSWASTGPARARRKRLQ